MGETPLQKSLVCECLYMENMSILEATYVLLYPFFQSINDFLVCLLRTEITDKW